MLVSVLAGLLALAGLSCFFVLRLRVPAPAAPFAGLLAVMLWLTASACAGLLVPGALAALAFGCGAGVWCVLKRGRLKTASLACAPFLLFFTAALFFVAALWAQKPVFVQWDEYSLWGTAAKVSYTTGALPGAGYAGFSERPALFVLTAFFTTVAKLAGAPFADWAVFAAYDLLALAVFCLCAAPAARRGAWATLPVFVLLTLAPFVFESLLPGAVSHTYISSMGDLPLALLTAGALGLYFTAENRFSGRRLAAVCAALLVLTLTRDVGLVLGLIVVMIIGLDLFTAGRHQVVLGRAGGFSRAALATLAMAGAVLAGFFVWGQYVARFLSVERYGADGSAGLTMPQIVVQGVTMLLGFGRSEKFSQVLSAMKNAFLHRPVFMGGSGIMLLGVTLCLFGAAFLLEPGRREKLRALICAVAGAVGQAGFMVFYLFSYVFIFGSEGGQLASYERYTMQYTLAFFMLGLVLLFSALARRGRRSFWVVYILCLVTVCTGLITGRLNTRQNFLRISAADGDSRVRQLAQLAPYEQELLAGDRIYFISQGDDSARRFVLCYGAAPARVVPTLGSGTLIRPGTAEGNGYSYIVEAGSADLKAYLDKTQANLVYFDIWDGYVQTEFAPLFSDRLAQLSEDNRLYRLAADGLYHPVNTDRLPGEGKEGAR